MGKFFQKIRQNVRKYYKKMRRNTLLPNKTHLQLLKSRRHQTMIKTELNELSLPQQKFTLIAHFIHSESIVRQFIQGTLIKKIEEEMDRRQLNKIVNQTMNQCSNLFDNQNWQIDPNGTLNQRRKDPQIKIDDQPKFVRFAPILDFDKKKKPKIAKIQSQISLQLSRLKMNSLPNQFNKNALKSTSRKSIINTHRTISSNNNSTLTKDFPKLIPLKLDINPNTPQGSYRRNLQDFLRQKKINAEINLGYKIKYFDEKQNHGLKTIRELPVSSFLSNPFKNEGALGQNLIKLPLISAKQETVTDYDGGEIPLKKVSKKSKQLLKTVCKIKNSCDEIKKPVKQKNKVGVIKIRAPIIRIDYPNILTLSARNKVQEDLKLVIEQNLHTNRVTFREIDQNLPNPGYELQA